MRVEVLLSTYNGARHLRTQVDSVLAQRDVEVRLTVRDDGSSDATPMLLQEYAGRDPRVRWTSGPNLGAAASFLALLAARDPAADGTAFCDQDDRWDPDHLARALVALSEVPSGVPALWCSRVLVCDAELRPLHPHALAVRGPSFANALVENIATGAAIVLNPAAADLLRRARPDHVVMHDAWCYLAVSGTGQVLYDPAPSVRYRLHETNTMGLGRDVLARLRGRLRRQLAADSAGAWRAQAADLRRLLGDDLSDDARRELDAFLDSGATLAGRLRYAVSGEARRQRLGGTLAVRLLYALGRV